MFLYQPSTSPFASRLKSTLHDTHMTQREFAQKTGITEAAVSRYVTGKRIPHAKTLQVIANVLNTSVDELLGTPTPNEELINSVTIVCNNINKLSTNQRFRLIFALSQDTSKESK